MALAQVEKEKYTNSLARKARKSVEDRRKSAPAKPTGGRAASTPKTQEQEADEQKQKIVDFAKELGLPMTK